MAKSEGIVTHAADIYVALCGFSKFQSPRYCGRSHPKDLIGTEKVELPGCLKNPAMLSCLKWTGKLQVPMIERWYPVSVVYSEIIWLGGIVLALTVAAVIGLRRRQDIGAIEPVKPLLLSPMERELLLLEKTLALQKAVEAKNATKRARRDRRRQLAASNKTGPTA
ncbi:MAG: hypothetical protein EPO10_07280 [Reyranella sp.]|uniref:hypothetical protein n=1 Tax=Reyranella sp. TaxID=1929291 RepID=UPI0011F43400|nr:hypothetical protein [Reyranella sp.]TAJ92128.1 MAG: hypothetical protein EPO41_14560 [Reyranella sp.]TBR29573.1 MAG: hypothetical protein EPO10_07280 [Reyranella sp.]